MSVNHTYAISEEKTRRFGKYFSTIDFEVSTTSKRLLEQRQEQIFIGKFQIDGKEYQLTLEELDRIIETCQLAKTIYLQKLRLNQ